MREACSAGARAKSIVAIVDAPTTNANTRTSKSSRGNRRIGPSDAGSVFTSSSGTRRSPQAESARPAAPAIAARHAPSVKSCITTRARLAPMDRRTAISRWRRIARASITFDTLAHAVTSTSTNGTNTGVRIAMTWSVSSFGPGWGSTTAATSCSRSNRARMNPASAPSACGTVTPAASLATMTVPGGGASGVPARTERAAGLGTNTSDR